MIKKITIEKIARLTKDKQGNQLKTKDGKSYERVLLTVNGKTISGFGNQSNADWKAGDEVQLDITVVQKDNNTYYNFAPVNMTTVLISRVDELEKRVAIMEKAYPTTSTGEKVPDFSEADEPPVEAYKDEEIVTEDLPF